MFYYWYNLSLNHDLVKNVIEIYVYAKKGCNIYNSTLEISDVDLCVILIELVLKFKTGNLSTEI